MAKILIIEDHGVVRDALKVILTAKGHEVLAAADGVSGVNLFRSGAPDLVVSDRNLPKLSGSEVVKEIRKSGRGVKIIILTAHADPDGERKYRSLGADAFLSKTADMRVLIAAIERLLV